MPFRYGFKRDADPTTLYILHLALVDFLFCATSAAVFSLHYFSTGGWPLGELPCVATVVVKISLMFLDWISLALITSSRYVLLRLPPERRNRLYGPGKCAVPVAIIWTVTFVVLLPFAVHKVRMAISKRGQTYTLLLNTCAGNKKQIASLSNHDLIQAEI